MRLSREAWLLTLARVLSATQRGIEQFSWKGSISAASQPHLHRLRNCQVEVPAVACALRGHAAASAPAYWQIGWRSAWGMPAAAATLLAAVMAATPAMCEGQHGDADLAGVRAAVMLLWEQLDEELERLEAGLRGGEELGKLPQPSVWREGGEVVVEFLVPQQLDVGGALLELRRQLRHPAFGSLQEGMAGSSVSEESTSGRAGRAWTLHRRSKALGDLQVEVEQPRDPHTPARFCFRAAGGVQERDLRLMGSTLHEAMHPRRSKGPSNLFEREFGGALSELGPLGRMFESMEPFLGHVQEMVEDFQRMQQGMSMGEEEEDERHEGMGFGEERDTLPTPLRRPKRFDDLAGSGRYGAGAEEGERGDLAEGRAQRRQQAKMDEAVKKLQGQGAQVFLPANKQDIDWGVLAGYDAQKRQIEDTVLLALMHPEVYDDIARKTRRQFASNRPRAVLFEGPPGTGKTTSARVMATQAAVPLVYLPLEAIVSKWYGESERMLADMLKACESFPDGCIIFLDELDALATSRATDMHEATRRVLGVLLRHLDGFDANKRTVVIGATNRRQDLDPALISRFSSTVTFDLPTEDCRAKILQQYAQHLSDAELLALAHDTPGMAGRDLRDVCEQAERHWASKIIRGAAKKGQLPPLSEYLEGARQRVKELAGAERPPMTIL